jgi:PAS domain S-box-containing protein
MVADNQPNSPTGAVMSLAQSAQPPRRTSRIASQVVVAFTVFLLAMVWGGVAYQLNYDRKEVVDAARANNDNLARAYAEHVLGTVRLLDQVLLRVKTGYEKNALGPDLVRSLHDAADVDADALLVQVLDAHGYVMATTLSTPPTSSFADREYFRVHAKPGPDQLYISEPIAGRITGRHTVIVLSRGLRKPNGDFAGVAYVSYDPQYLSGFFSDLAIAKNSTFAIVGRDMIIRDMIEGSGGVKDKIGKSVARSQLVPALEHAPNGDYQTASVIDGVPRLFSYRSLPDFPLVVVAGMAEADVLAGYRERKAWLLGLAAALSLVFVGVAILQLRRIARQAAAEQELRRTQELLVQSQRVAKLGYIVHDLAAGRLYWSDSLFELRRVPRRNWFTFEEGRQFLDCEDRPKYIAARNAALAERRGFSIDLRVRRPDGTVCWEHRSAHPHFDERGNPVYLLMVVQDITERKNAEIELARSRDNMLRAQSVAALGSFERDLVTRRIDWSDEMYRILGYEKGQIEAGFGAVVNLVHPDDRAKFLAAKDAGIDGINTASLEFRIIRPDGAVRTIYRENAVIFDEKGTPTRLCGSYQDITERRSGEERERELERKLMHSQKLEALGTLAGGIAHDLNNTLTPIMALSKLTARRLEPGSPLHANVETIYMASEQARDLVKRVLAFSRQDKIDRKPANLHDIVADALKLLRATIPSSLQLESRLGDVPPILADGSQIHQVVTNLVNNAAQAIGDGRGTITVTLDFVEAGTAAAAIRLSVADTGHGMDEITRQRIFEPFFTTKRVGQGTGLGLSITDGIVTAHGGRIEVESELGKGSRFDIYFPPLEATDSAAA